MRLKDPLSLYYATIAAFYVVLTLLSSNIPFFWDNILLVSKTAYHYYEHGWGNLILPTQFDSGHPPFYPIYVSAVWACLGKTLWASHLAVLPFLVAMGMAYMKLVQLLLPRTWWWLALLFLAIEPAVLTQSAMGAIDIPLIAGHLWALWGLLRRRSWVVAVGMLLMCLVSLRGIITSLLLVVVAVVLPALPILFKRVNRSALVADGLARVAVWGSAGAFLCVVAWYYYHFSQTGFWVHNPQSAWATAPDNRYYEAASLGEALWHIAVMGWRMLDQGRILWWVLLIGWVGRYGRANIHRLDGVDFQLFMFIFVPLLLYVSIVAVRNNPIMTRYFLSYFLLIQLLTLRLWALYMPTKGEVVGHKWSKRAMGLLCTAMLTGHAWIYPYPISNSWDTTLAFLPYLPIQRELFDYADAQKIPYAEVGSAFPMFNARKYIYLTTDTLRFTDKIKRPLRNFEYVCYANISNEFTPENLQRLATNFDIEKQFNCGYMWAAFYRCNE